MKTVKITNPNQLKQVMKKNNLSFNEYSLTPIYKNNEVEFVFTNKKDGEMYPLILKDPEFCLFNIFN